MPRTNIYIYIYADVLILIIILIIKTERHCDQEGKS